MAATVDVAERSDPAGAHPALARRGSQPPRKLLDCCTSAGRLCTFGTVATAPMVRRIGGPAALGDGRRCSPPDRRAHSVSDHRTGARRGNALEHPADGALRRRYAMAGAEVWQAADVKPHRLKTFTLSHDRSSPRRSSTWSGSTSTRPNNALVLSVDEKTQIQALDRDPSDAPAAARAGRASHPRLQAARDRESLCCLQRRHRRGAGRITRRHRATEFRQFLAHVDRATSPELAL